MRLTLLNFENKFLGSREVFQILKNILRGSRKYK